MIRKWITCWGSSSGDLGDVEYPFIVISPRSTQSGSCNSICGSNRSLLKPFVSDRTEGKKKKKKKKTCEETWKERKMNAIP